MSSFEAAFVTLPRVARQGVGFRGQPSRALRGALSVGGALGGRALPHTSASSRRVLQAQLELPGAGQRHQQRTPVSETHVCLGAVACLGLAARSRAGQRRTLAAAAQGARSFAGLTSAAAFGRKKAPSAEPHSEAGAPRSLSSSYRGKLQQKGSAAGAPPSGAFVDTHCHLDMILPRLEREFKKDVQKAQEAGKPLPRGLKPGYEGWRASLEGPMESFDGCVHVGCSADSLDTGVEFLAHEGVHGAFGIHPLVAEDWSEELEEKLWDLMGLEKVVAWGECGLDYFDKTSRGKLKNQEVIDLQRHVFTRQLELASQAGMPLVVHTRNAEEDTLELMKKHLPESHPVHVHCFTSSLGLAEKLLAHFPRLCIGFTGVVTFRNAQEVQEVVRQVPLDRILLETDGPYMAPEPCRGRVAHPGHVFHVGERIAKLKGIEAEEVFKTCRENTRQLYGF